CCNQLEYTRRCLESVLSCTRHTYELILVDNGSTDGTSEYFSEIAKAVRAKAAHSPPDRLEVILNETNRGYPAGCNQALGRSLGRYLVFLNNDTVVTEGWLDGLMACARHDQQVGLVGPVTNCASGPQQILVDYQHLSDLPAFGARLREEKAGRGLRVDRLTGFCLLGRRVVVEVVGGFDGRVCVVWFGCGAL